jgi:hypothetical protein
MSLPRHAHAASCPTPRLPDESSTCPPAFMSILSCPSPSTIRSPRRSPRQQRQVRARPLQRISPGPPRAGRKAPRPARRATVLTLRRPLPHALKSDSTFLIHHPCTPCITGGGSRASGMRCCGARRNDYGAFLQVLQHAAGSTHFKPAPCPVWQHQSVPPAGGGPAGVVLQDAC